MALVSRMIILSLAVGASQGLAAPAPAPTPGAAAGSTLSLAALKMLEPGLWQLDVKGRAPHQSCVADMMALIQIEHDQPGCSRFVIANEPKNATVHYSCQRTGWGRTTVRVETSTAATIQTQGISRNQPFDYQVQARRIGACGSVTAAKK